MERIAVALEAQVRIMKRQEQQELEEQMKEENSLVTDQIAAMFAGVGKTSLDLTDLDSALEAFEAAYTSDHMAEVEDARRSLRDIFLFSSMQWQDAAEKRKRPRRGIMVNPGCHIFRKVKATVLLVLADRFNAIYGLGHSWDRAHLDSRLEYLVADVLPELINETDKKSRKALNAILATAQDVIAMAQ